MVSLRRYVVPVLFTATMFTTLVGLGSWQIERWGAKQRLVARVAERITAAPVPAPLRAAWPDLRGKNDEYRRVVVTGRFLHDKETYLYTSWAPEGRDAVQGWSIFTPMETADGIVLVDRGFVPEQKRDPASRPESLVSGRAEVTGLLRLPERRSAFGVADNPGKREFFVRDPKAMAAAVGLAEVAPYVVAADATPVPGGWPKGGNTRVKFPDNHLQYAITWFTLAIAVLALFAVWVRRARKDADSGAGADIAAGA